MRQYRPVKQPEHAHPLVKRLFAEMHREQIGIMDMCERSGVNPQTLKAWRTRNIPTVASLEACLNVVGLELVAKKKRWEDD